MTGSRASFQRVLIFLAAMHVAAFGVLGQVSQEDIAKQPGFVLSEFVAPKPETVFSHTSTIVQTKDGKLICAWIGGSKERSMDMTVWASTFDGKKWGAP